MRRALKFLLVAAVALVISGASFAGNAQARTDVYIGGSVTFGPYWGFPWYGPYDPWFGPYPYYEPPPDYGYLKTKVEPKEAEVWVNGRFFGVADEFDSWWRKLKLPLGIHEARFRLKGYETYAVNFTMTSGDTTVIERELRPVPPGEEEKALYGTLNVRVVPVGADIYVDGVYSGTTSESWGREGVGIDFPPGRHQVIIRKEGYRDYTTDVLVREADTVNVDAELTPSEPGESPGL